MIEEIRSSLPIEPPALVRTDLLFRRNAALWETIEGCTHCGMCLNQCPTYRLLGDERESPRGRIYLMKSATEGRAEIDAAFYEHMTVCLACRACETACPATLGFGRLVEAARAEAVARVPLSRGERLGHWLIFRHLFPHPARLRLLAAALRLYQTSGFRAFVRRSGLMRLLPPRLAAIEPLQPDLTGPWFPADDRVYPARGERRAQVALFNGCIQPLAFGATNAATVRVLQANGCEVVVPRDQICCGALAIHAGERGGGIEQARRNIEAFERLQVDAIIVNAAGCGLALKEYPELFHDDPVWHARAVAFSARVQDVSEWLVALGPRPPARPLRLRVTYQDPCHLAHGQRVRSQPRELLGSIPGLELVEMRASDRCCGSAGIYNIARHELSMQVLNEKMSNVVATRPDVIVSANPGCIIQLRHGCEQYGLASEVVHLVDLLDRAYASG